MNQAKIQRLTQWVKRKFDPKNLFQLARSPSQVIEEEEEEEWFEPLEQELTQKWQVDLLKHSDKLLQSLMQSHSGLRLKLQSQLD